MSKLSLIQADITQLKVDAIVNAAHEALMGGGGVDGAIHRAAGPELLRACRDIPINSSGVRCNAGEAHVTPGFRLLAKYVIHTVSPRFVGSAQRKVRRVEQGSGLLVYNNVHPGTEEDLARCYASCLGLAQKNGCKSIAFPSLGTGGHGWPIEVAAPIAIKAVREWMKSGTMDCVYLVAFLDHDFETYKKAMEINQLPVDCGNKLVDLPPLPDCLK